MESLQGSAPSVTKEQLERYMKYKRDMERKLGVDTKSQRIEDIEPTLYGERRPHRAGGGGAGGGGGGGAGGAPGAAPASGGGGAGGSSGAPAPAAAPRSFADDDDDDIYADD